MIIEIKDIHNLTGADIDGLKNAAGVLRNSGIVVFPTETVYGLGACAQDPAAVKKIFKAKGRPSDNPLIVHVSDRNMVEALIADKHVLNEMRYDRLISEFWPGPLTVIFQKNKDLSDEVTAGLDTVGIRMPENPVALKLIELTGCGIAAPSANTSGKPSPTTAEHVKSDMSGRADVIITADDCDVGVESTVLDMTCEPAVILRPGGVSRESIERVLGEKVLLAKELEEDAIPKAPGMKYRHYAPEGKLLVFFGEEKKVAQRINEMAIRAMEENKKPLILATEQTICYYDDKYSTVWGDNERPETFARSLYSVLRYCDICGADIIFAEAVSTDGIGEAVMNRLLKASGYAVIRV